MRGVVLYKSRNVERVEDARSVLNMGGNKNGGEGRKKGYIYSSACDLIYILHFLVHEHKRAQPSSCTTTRHYMNEEA
jgi:hypothetical protein